jgi:DEP domain-containing protein 5
MLVAGYEHQFNESLRYWRTRFIVIPTAGPPNITTGANGEPLSEEEIRIHGIEKLADIFTKLRWVPPEDRSLTAPVKFVHTTLSPVASVLDELVLTELDRVHAAGPLKKNMQSNREIAGMSLVDVARAMRESDGITIKTNVWLQRSYYDSFTGTDFVNWLLREFKDVSNRPQATELGVRFLEQGLFIHCKGSHGFLDGCDHILFIIPQSHG